MEITYVVHFEDETGRRVTIEKPPGAHPESVAALLPAIEKAEEGGQVVRTIGRSKYSANNATRAFVVHTHQSRYK